jgi:hypothetical protein
MLRLEGGDDGVQGCQLCVPLGEPNRAGRAPEPVDGRGGLRPADLSVQAAAAVRGGVAGGWVCELSLGAWARACPGLPARPGRGAAGGCPAPSTGGGAAGTFQRYLVSERGRQRHDRGWLRLLRAVVPGGPARSGAGPAGRHDRGVGDLVRGGFLPEQAQGVSKADRVRAAGAARLATR